MSRPKSNYEQLRAEWYKKLKDDGFKDTESIEDIDQDRIQALRRESYSRDMDPVIRQATEDYYQIAAVFLSSYTFETELDKIVWEYHTNGLSVRSISETLGKAKIKRAKTQVWEIIKRLEHKMKLLHLVGHGQHHES